MHRFQSTSKLSIDFENVNPIQSTMLNPFQYVKAEMLKRREKLAIRKKPIQYEKLEQTIENKLKTKCFDSEKQRGEMVILEKCKNYFHVRRKNGKCFTSSTNSRTNSNKSRFNHKSRTLTEENCTNPYRNRIKNVMDDCMSEVENEQTKQRIELFIFYCQMMNKRLGGIKRKIEKKEKMI